MNISYTDRAKDDVEIAFSWYENQKSGLGFDFLNSIEVSLNNISKFPKLYNNCYKNFRRSLIKKFPFAIFYTIEDSEIIIHSVFDNRQDPIKRP
ncbi:MAG: type II toxin-antitoxin system RelE/ParE family toxin [Ignavibacteriae bacterium]|nr:type II toxin-antitoxin system RelE/ParE family toxin [Ignavibacteriota bacterium]